MTQAIVASVHVSVQVLVTGTYAVVVWLPYPLVRPTVADAYDMDVTGTVDVQA